MFLGKPADRLGKVFANEVSIGCVGVEVAQVDRKRYEKTKENEGKSLKTRGK